MAPFVREREDSADRRRCFERDNVADRDRCMVIVWIVVSFFYFDNRLSQCELRTLTEVVNSGCQTRFSFREKGKQSVNFEIHEIIQNCEVVQIAEMERDGRDSFVTAGGQTGNESMFVV